MLFVNRFRAGGFKIPHLLYTDMCCVDRQLIAEIFEELRQSGVDFRVEDYVSEGPSKPTFQLPVDIKLVCVEASRETNELRAHMDIIRSAAEATGNVVGFDMEWEPSIGVGTENPPATVQLAAGRVVLVCQILHGQRSVPKKIPASLANILSDSTVQKVGAGIGGDKTKLEKFYGTTMSSTTDLRTLAITRGVDAGRSKGLADMCSHFLGQKLCKENRISAWNTKKLAPGQIM